MLTVIIHDSANIATFTLTIGAGGTGGASNNTSGGNGGTTTFVYNSITYSATGG